MCFFEHIGRSHRYRIWRIEFRREPGRWVLSDEALPKSQKKRSLPCLEVEAEGVERLGLFAMVSRCISESKGAPGTIIIWHPDCFPIELQYEGYKGKYGSGIRVLPFVPPKRPSDDPREEMD